jgi:thiol-disulfide isomerase/thioredoxin
MKRRQLLAAALGFALLAGSAASAGLEKFSRPSELRPAPDVEFTTMDGEVKNLSDFRGRVVLVNTWATWCAPCIEEMPSLVGLQKAFGREEFLVLALNSDRGGARVVEPFLKEHGLESLAVYLDPRGNATRKLGVKGLPTSILLDAEGRELGRLLGTAKWDSAEAQSLIRAAIGEGAVLKTSAP